VITDSFEARTLANMEVALESACRLLPAGSNSHEKRQIVANEILRQARSGDARLTSLTRAGETAARRLARSEPHVA
jgi:hypothetical protein